MTSSSFLTKVIATDASRPRRLFTAGPVTTNNMILNGLSFTVVVIVNCPLQYGFPPGLLKFAYTFLSSGLYFRFKKKLFSEITLISAPISILKSTSEPCIGSETVHAFLFSFACLVLQRKCVAMACSYGALMCSRHECDILQQNCLFCCIFCSLHS